MTGEPLLGRRRAVQALPPGPTGQSAAARGEAPAQSVEAAPQLHAVDDVSFMIGRGETVGLVGESGCGKSTLARLVARLIDGTSGSVRLAGRELTHVSARGFAGSEDRARIQMVFQDAGESINPRYSRSTPSLTRSCACEVCAAARSTRRSSRRRSAAACHSNCSRAFRTSFRAASAPASDRPRRRRRAGTADPG